MAETLKEKILKTLVSSNKISANDLEEAKEYQKERGIGLDRALVEKGLINEQDLMVLLVKELHIPFINPSKYKFDPSLKDVISEKVARQYHLIPISQLENTITVALADPLNVFAIDDLKNLTGCNIDVVMSTDTDIMKAIDNFYGTELTTSVKDVSKDIVADEFEIVMEDDSAEEDITADEGDQAPIIRLVNLIIKEALKQRASDIHIEPQVENVRVRYRVDGVLQEILTFPKDNQNAVTIRIKIMSRVDITSTNVPQDGRFKMKVGVKEVDFRVSLLPTTFGQKIVMRVLDKHSLSVGLEGLGFSKRSIKLLQKGAKKPFGMVLVTGPTGSGKSTTLYSIINELNTIDKNIITVEDPVEYLTEGLTQIQVKPEIGLTFASGLRSILRQSPDVVMVGEIRDAETADIAIKASLTGQIVFSTLHTNDAAGALTRLVDMDVEPFLVASSLVLVCAQRLCRKICPKCKEEEEVPKETLEKLGVKVDAKMKFFHGKGCKNCRNTGYLGRLGLTEIMEVTEDVKDLLIRGKSSDDIKDHAMKNDGMVTLFEDGIQKIKDGSTTLEEVLRVTASE